ncbi:Pre-rRNA-processing protein ipi1 [Taphrina deformans PYCC 5710]|uniref:Pre-rRNA-processing protein n=1 Tax=Taphrina deformans (strain PYCC 5710 / ATCC 11124 / CBS 356.35 / IMI 108563 / JCM 9778 / NBRC 8474) TaxID=1097556 RepID=R4X8X6_TAPDE|nr:Pre-rRNA-processing protein ipi1 [Taphrina deformans PYCC 5710]|eukprot:CCG82088.1 Pre-rRNA-processing protein ipi1 [Taphrina deformans PYCC 5710]
MAKISKSVREKRKDFAKTKLKVGKSRQLPANHTDTSFRSKAVVLPKQSVTQEANVKELQTLSHLLALLSHKSGDTRKDALQQLTAHLAANPPRLSTIVTPVMKALCPLIIDDTTSVRKQLLEILNSVLSKLPRQTLNTHVRLLLLYVSSAMTHISPSIRADSTKYLDWTMKNSNAVEIIIADQLPQYMNTFATLFGWIRPSNGIGNNRVLSFHLSCFHYFLNAVLHEDATVVPDVLELTIPLSYGKDIFIPHRATQYMIQNCQALNLFSFTTSNSADASNFDSIEPHMQPLLKYMSDKFIDSVNGDRSLCTPILHIMKTLVSSPLIRHSDDCKATLRTIGRGIDNIDESVGRGFVQGVIGEWRLIKEELG